MVERKNILIFPAGSEIGLEIFSAIRYNLHLEVFGLSGKSDYARMLYEDGHYFEGNYYVQEPSFIQALNQVLDDNKIELIIPTHDTVTLYLAEHANEIHARVLTSSVETARIAREKKLIYALFSDTEFCPHVYDRPFHDLKFPVFLKPNIGEGGKHTQLVSGERLLLEALQTGVDFLVCEYLPGEELSVDCFTSKDRKLLFVGPRTRERVQMGISFRSAVVPLTEEIQAIAEEINRRLKIRGAWFFQIKKDVDGKFKLLEFAVRQASTMGLYRQLGVNFALLSIFDALDLEVTVIRNNYHVELERALTIKYKADLHYERVYIDFDDTIVINDKVNDAAIRYLYYCRNRNIRISLLTKHRFDLTQSLEKYAICSTLFDEIILLADHDDKADHIDRAVISIFIDNYFFDRLSVSKKLGIPVFDVDAIEGLME